MSDTKLSSGQSWLKNRPSLRTAKLERCNPHQDFWKVVVMEYDDQITYRWDFRQSFIDKEHEVCWNQFNEWAELENLYEESIGKIADLIESSVL